MQAGKRLRLSSGLNAPGRARLALIIGNNDHRNQQPLRNSVNDAVAMGDALRGLGWASKLMWSGMSPSRSSRKWRVSLLRRCAPAM
jgi:hypothetical protein